MTHMDEAKLSAILTELKSVKALLASVERDNIALDERIAGGERSQRLTGYYLLALFILFTVSMVVSYILIV
jgi:hypothetical protein